MTDLYAVTISPAAMCDLFEAENDRTGNLPPNYSAAPGALVPVVLKDETGGQRTVELMRWGLPASAGEAPVTAIHDISDRRWPDLVKPEHRCLIPANSFSEGRARNWFARDEIRTPFAFAGVWLGTSRGGHRRFAILSSDVNRLAGADAQPMPVVLTEDEWDEWLDGDNEEARAVLKPPAEELLTVVSTGEERDPPESRMGYQ